MAFALTDEQRMLQESIDRFVERDYGFDIRNDIIAGEDGFSRDHWRSFAELGWLGVPFDEEDGGFGGSIVDACLVMEAFGRGLVVEPYLWTVVLGGGLLQLSEQTEWLGDLIGGELQMAVAFAEPKSRFSLSHVETTATMDGGGYRISGRKAVVFNAGVADRIIIPARTSGDVRDERGISLFLIDRNMPGLSFRTYPTVDGLRAAEISLENVTVGAETMIGGQDGGYALLEEVVDRGIAAVCCEASGIMQTVVTQTQDYIKTRNQFGVPLSSFQVLQHRMSEMFIHKEQSLSLSHMAAITARDGDALEIARASSAAKAYIGEKGRLVGQDAIQMHGGMGMTAEMPISHYFKRLTMIDTLFGNTDHHLTRFADLSMSEQAAA